MYFFDISHHLENRPDLNQLCTMVDAGGIQTCFHPHVSHQFYHCVDIQYVFKNRFKDKL